MNNKITKSISLILSVCILFCTCPNSAHGKWRDRSSELPGMVSSEETTKKVIGALLICGAIGVTVWALSPKKNSKIRKKVNQKEKQVMKDNLHGSLNWKFNKIDFNALNVSFQTTENFLQEIENVSQKIPVELYVTPSSLSNNLAFKSSKGIEVGMKFRF